MKSSLQQFFLKSSLDLKFRADNPQLWDDTFTSLSYRPVDYSSSSINYQLAYQIGHGGIWTDLSSIILWDGKPVGIWPVTVSEKNGHFSLNSQGLPVLPPLFVSNLPASRRKAFHSACLSLAMELSAAIRLKQWNSHEPFQPRHDLSDWHLLSMARGSRSIVRHQLMVDLSLSLPEIKACFRKSFRALVNSGSRLWKVDYVQGHGNEDIWDEFRLFHAKVAGRVTRSMETWQLQHQSIVADEGFLVTLRDSQERMVGGGYFSCTKDEGTYSVGAYDRTLFDKPIGHVIQLHAIMELQRRQCRWYKIGTRCYPSDQPQPTEKELSIAMFKEGFATHVFPTFEILHTHHVDHINNL